MLTERQNHLDGKSPAVAQNRIDLERVIVPTALQASGERAAQRRLSGLVEQVHDRLTEQPILPAEELNPRRVGVNHNAFLDLHDGVIRALEDRLELAARIACGLEGGIERPLEPVCAQLANHHSLQTHGISQCHYIAGAEDHGVGDASLINRIRQHHQR